MSATNPPASGTVDLTPVRTLFAGNALSSTPDQRAGLAGWGVVLIAGAMTAAVSAESVRAALLEEWRYGLPTVVGFAGAALILRLMGGAAPRVGPTTERGWTILLCAVLPVLQVGLVLAVQAQPTSDWAVYRDSARRLWATGEYSCLMAGGVEFRAFKPPGVAIYLAGIQGLFGDSVLAAQLVNAAAVCIGNLLFYRLTRRRFGQRLAETATLIFALWPSRNFSILLLGYDAPGSLAVLTFWLLADGSTSQRWHRHLLAGLAAGAAALLRQPLLLLPFAFIIYKVATDRDRRGVWRQSMAMLAGLSIVIGLWAGRNHRVLGWPVATATQGGLSLYRAFHPDAQRNYTRVGWAELLEDSGGDELRLSGLAWERGVGFLVSDPAAAAIRILDRSRKLLESDHELVAWAFEAPQGPFSLAAFALARQGACGLSDAWYAGLALVTLVCGYRAVRRGPGQQDLLWPVLAIGTALITHALFESQSRYFVVYQCFWSVLAASVWHSAYLTITRREG